MNEVVYNYIREITQKYPEISEEFFSATSIAKHLNLNRSTISSYLNELYRKGLLIKIKTYPVLFLSKIDLIEKGINVNLNEYDNLNQIKHQNSTLESIIGAKYSLKEAIDQIKTAVMYPNKGLPILFIGASGSGKTYLASKVHSFAIEQNLIDKNAPFISYNCAQYANNSELLASVLFGYVKGAFTGANEDKEGLFDKADGGVLFLDEVHRLSEVGQEKLFTFMDSGEFSPLGDNSIKKKANIRLVFATTENIYSTFLPTFLRRLPVVVNLPKFQDRSQTEKIQLIDSFFLKESSILNREMQVTEYIFNFLINSDLEGNVGKIKNIIKYACASAFVKQKDDNLIIIRMKDLPKEFKHNITKLKVVSNSNYKDRHYIPNNQKQEFLETREESIMSKFYTDLFNEFEKINNYELLPKDFIEKNQNRVKLIMDEFIFRESYEKDKDYYSLLTYNLRQTFDYMSDIYGFNQSGNLVYALANYMYLNEDISFLYKNNNWENKINLLIEFLKKHLENPYRYAKKFLTIMAQQLDSDLKYEDLIFMTLYFHGLDLSSINSKIKCLILAHGYSTASSLSNVANRLLKKNVFQSFDMPIDITLEKIENHVIKYLEEYQGEEGLILLVDMGSLNQLGKRLEKYLKGPLLIIDHVSTPLVLEVGMNVINGESIDSIYKVIEEKFYIRKELIIPNLQKKKAIITCCYTGIGSAVKIQEVLQKSLGKVSKECIIIPYDYNKLLENKFYESPFQKYDILMIIGTEDPNISQVPYIGLDKIVNGEQLDSFISILKSYFDIDSNQLKEEFIFNFSIDKIIENLTILDATKLLNSVKISVKNIQRMFKVNFDSNQLFLLYLHCTSMVERILRKELIDDQSDIEEYLKSHSLQLDMIKSSFQNLENEYNIEIPLLELRLINNIIKG